MIRVTTDQPLYCDGTSVFTITLEMNTPRNQLLLHPSWQGLPSRFEPTMNHVLLTRIVMNLLFWHKAGKFSEIGWGQNTTRASWHLFCCAGRCHLDTHSLVYGPTYDLRFGLANRFWHSSWHQQLNKICLILIFLLTWRLTEIWTSIPANEQAYAPTCIPTKLTDTFWNPFPHFRCFFSDTSSF